MTAAGIVTTATMTSTTAVRSNVSVTMNPLAPRTPVKVASVGISTSTTMLRASDQDRASRVIRAPAITTGSEHASAHPTICQKSFAGIVIPAAGPGPQVAPTPHGLDAMAVAEFRAETFDVHRDR